MATLAHALQVVGWWIAPLIIFAVKRDSRFVAFHALQALLLQVAILVLWVLGMIGFFATMFATIPFNTGSTPPNGPPTAFFFFFPVFWLLGMGGWILVLVLAIVYAIKAGRGEWANYPIFGKLARRILKMDRA